MGLPLFLEFSPVDFRNLLFVVQNSVVTLPPVFLCRKLRERGILLLPHVMQLDRLSVSVQGGLTVYHALSVGTTIFVAPLQIDILPYEATFSVDYNLLKPPP